ncbi:MAG TPA: phosphate signaling complex protein PhoU [Coriobacteriia bacterium]|nr:phosphate signaling complex protein PhoU [Coriobacteriia bacterium]
MREQFTQELKDLHAEVVDIARAVTAATREAVTSLINGDVELAEKVIAGDDIIDARCLGIEERALETIATQFPVARDLRLLQSLTFIAMHLERMADLAVNIAKAARRTAGRKGPQTLYDLIQAQGNLVYRVLDATREALENRDLELSRKLPELDEPIDHLYKQFFRELARLHEEDEIEWASSMVMASRYLERIADNAVDIGERIAYLITGERERQGEPTPTAGGE